MKGIVRVLPWAISLVCLIGFVASFSELQRMRKRFGEVTRHAYHDHADVRNFIIGTEMNASDRPVVIVGDSIAEMARFPDRLCGHAVVNAGIGGATISELDRTAKRLLIGHDVSLFVVLAGTNDASSPTIVADYSRLLSTLKPQPVLAVSATKFGNVNELTRVAADSAGVRYVDAAFSDFLPNDVHPSPAGYKAWMPKVIQAINAECGR
ncbi:GDSL-type esterase/lipase family protein [Bradyrhizobium lablabi]|uniref:SGNH/GDSL hydrolase family protein n=1 Tax=Bradyrhizobium lablabi TaxID=722472 RepID=UPI001BA4E2DD|nr:GDSL-type esterase/lipase family protein [Bradyrhizobium lablabi]MBR0691684.1 hypothetical protein [Bradyrhizobium lablabi]